MKKKQIAITGIIIGISITGWWLHNHQYSSIKSSTNSTGYSKGLYSVDDPASVWVVVNKSRQLDPKTYGPTDLVVPRIPLRINITGDEQLVRQVTATALEKMVADASTQGLHFDLQSGYRSYDFQVNLYNDYVARQGKAAADSQSARPGYSEHQTGLAADLGSVDHPECSIENCFGNTLEGKWLAANGFMYGFIIRYSPGDQKVTGYIPEPWHVRYVGVALATEMHNRHVSTLEQFFGLPPAPGYN